MDDVEMRDSTAEEDALPPISFDALQYVQVAQSQHGLRHSDFARYRQYCTKKAHRLRTSLKLQQGRGKFVRKPVELAAVTTSGHLQLALISAERSWAWAQESKGQAEGQQTGKTRQNTLRRLAKSALHAEQFASFATKRGTPRTALEAQAYAAHIRGLHHMEYADRRSEALLKLQKAQRLCRALAGAGSFEQQAAAQQRLDEIEPVLRFVKYQLQQGGGRAPAAEAAGADDEDLQEQLQALESESREASGGAASAVSGGPAYFQWRGSKYAAFGERLKAALQGAAALAPEAQAGSSAETRLAALEKLAAALNEAKAIVRHSLATSGGSGPAAADALADLKALNAAVSGRQLEVSVERHLLQAAQAEARLGDAVQLDPAEKPRRIAKGKRTRGQGPMAVVRLYDSLLSDVKDLTEVAGQLGGAAGEYLLDECNAKAAEFRARRCLYVARSYLSDGKAREAFALFSRAQQRAAEAVTQHEECASPDATAISGLETLAARAGAWQVVAQASALAAEEKLREGVGSIALKEGPSEAATKYMVDDLKSWTSYAGGEAEAPRLAPLPPRLQSIPMRPILLDCALGYIKPPDLARRAPKGEATSTIGRLFGWGARK